MTHEERLEDLLTELIKTVHDTEPMPVDLSTVESRLRMIEDMMIVLTEQLQFVCECLAGDDD